VEKNGQEPYKARLLASASLVAKEHTKGILMHQSIPVHELPNGKCVYQDRGNTYSHQHPTEPWWCEKHKTVEEAVECYRKQLAEIPKKA
jgi:hypothetical protein